MANVARCIFLAQSGREDRGLVLRRSWAMLEQDLALHARELPLIVGHQHRHPGEDDSDGQEKLDGMRTRHLGGDVAPDAMGCQHGSKNCQEVRVAVRCKRQWARISTPLARSAQSPGREPGVAVLVHLHRE